MKKYIFILIALSLFSCKKELDEKVYSDLTSTIFYRNVEDATSAIYGVYNAMNRANNDWDNTMYSLVFVPSKYVVTRVAGRKLFSNFTYGTSDVALSSVWRNAYITINRANSVIDNVPGISMNETTKKQIVAEAKFLRAVTYFNLVRLFGGVPLRTSSTTSLNDVNLPRSTAQQVYDLIIEDLKVGETNLPDIRVTAEKGRATSGAASGLLGKVYMTMAGAPLNQADKWVLARDKFKFIIDNKARWGYDLMSNFADVFSLQLENNKEMMFSIQYSHVTDQGSVLAFFAAPLASTFATSAGQYHFGFTPAFRNLFSATDTRRDVTVVYSYVDNQGLTTTYGVAPIRNSYNVNGMALGKFKDGVGAPTNVNHANNIPVLRYADILLMYAEAQNEVNDADPVNQALAYTAINAVRARASATLPPLSGLLQGPFRDAIRRERLFELSGELTEFFDIQRWGTLQDAMTNDPEAILAGTAYNPKFALYPIPSLEVDANTKIEPADQNPGWN